MDRDLVIALTIYSIFSLIFIGASYWAGYAPSKSRRSGLIAAVTVAGMMALIFLSLYLFVFPHLQELKELH